MLVTYPSQRILDLKYMDYLLGMDSGTARQYMQVLRHNHNLLYILAQESLVLKRNIEEKLNVLILNTGSTKSLLIS